VGPKTIVRAADPGLAHIATVVTPNLARGSGEMPEFHDDYGTVVKISTAGWHDLAYHNGAQRRRKQLLDRAEKRGTDIRALEALIPSGRTRRRIGI
jgi:hypothetical protein